MAGRACALPRGEKWKFDLNDVTVTVTVVVVCSLYQECHLSSVTSDQPAQRQLSYMNVRSSLRPIFLLNGCQTTHVIELTVTVVRLHGWVLTFWDGHAEENGPILCLQTMTNADWWTSSQQFNGCLWNQKLMQVHFWPLHQTLEKIVCRLWLVYVNIIVLILIMIADCHWLTADSYSW